MRGWIKRIHLYIYDKLLFFLDIIEINIAYNISDNSKPNANKQLLNQFVEHSRKNKETNLLKTGKNDDILEVESGISSEPTPFH